MTDNQNSDVKFLDRNPPQITETEARTIAKTLYGLTGDFKPLLSERDQNYRIKTKSGECFVMKMANADENPDVIDFQIQALLHIEQQDPSLPVPRVLTNNKGTKTDIFKAEKGTRHIVYVLTYLSGSILDDVETPSALMWRNLGKMMAQLNLSLMGFFHSHAQHEMIWDTMRCLSLRQHTHCIKDSATRQNIDAIFDHMDRDVLPKLKGFRHQVIHGDATAMNTLTNPDIPNSISGVLDFGDAIYAPLIIEVANTIDLERLDPKDYLEGLSNVTAGFDSVLPLTSEEIDLVYDLVLVRHAIIATIVAWRREMCPDQPSYLLDSEATAGRVIGELRQLGHELVTNKLRDICRFPPYCPMTEKSQEKEDVDKMLQRRFDVLGTDLSLFYTKPIHVERGQGPWLYSTQGKAFLDCYNNVPVVGHCHPHVVKAISRQTAALNTNTRYLYGNILDYAERITSSMPEKLSVCVFVNSGSEANDIALRMARFMTGRHGALVMHNAYHGITESIADLTPYDVKAEDLAPHVRTLISPDTYRGIYKKGDGDLAALYAADTERAISDLAQNGHQLSACMIDTAFISNGIPEVPSGYLSKVAQKVQTAGGLMIADEVQAGFGRSGTHLWGFMAQDIVPDFVTIGKPVGNGYPLGIIVTSPEILNTFVKATDLFSTFGGNPVACAAGMAVLDVIEQGALIENAQKTGQYLRQGLRSLMSKHTIIGDVRGTGMLAGIELVKDRTTLEPAATETNRMLDLLCDNGVLAGSEGPFFNVLKIRPPMIFQPNHVDILVEALDRSFEML